eukprot:CAMPEP_0172654222 /NCGR_PEP_ID=MMETSP1068-20121228/244221_1 /TAXON_ID=35684 /ORGANISM="Pseudopedinella elastica, Strain CCMP716" /LENGTH=566 /DNA_ID=CAMNT_0013468663 /DNA_START=507 /DNA_END=2207 /DNA_ORIENTATION=+
MSEDGHLECETAPGLRIYVGDFSTPSLGELRTELAASTRAPSEQGLEFKHLCAPTGVQSLILDPQCAGAVFQAASQFNCLEMVGPGVSPASGISQYFSDPTQGPKCALACPAGTVYRNYLCQGGKGQGKKQLDCLADTGRVVGNENGAIWTMQNGYALPKSPKSMGALGERLEADPAFAAEAEAALRVGVHWETSVKPPATHTVSQVYASACPVAYAKNTKSKDWAPFARLVLRAAYEATLCAAAVKAWRGRKVTGGEEQAGRDRVAVYLTALGGGAFGNRIEWITEAIQGALEKMRHEPLDVYLVHYGSQVKSAYKSIAFKSGALGLVGRPVGGAAGLVKDRRGAAQAADEGQETPPQESTKGAAQVEGAGARRVIFLDVDGVLHPLGPDSLPLEADRAAVLARADWEPQGEEQQAYPVLPGEFTPECMAALRRLVEAVSSTNHGRARLELVLSSTWRLEIPMARAVAQQLEVAGIPLACQPLSATPSLGPGPSRRAREIMAWLDEAEAGNHGPGADPRFCVLDDQDLCADNDEVAEMLRPNFRRVQESSGLSNEDVEAALKILL